MQDQVPYDPGRGRFVAVTPLPQSRFATGVFAEAEDDGWNSDALQCDFAAAEVAISEARRTRKRASTPDHAI